jgi:hypothetical protein
LIRILRPIVEPKADLLPIGDAVSFIAAAHRAYLVSG